MQISEIKLELFRYIDKLDNNSLIKIYNYLIEGVKDKTTDDFWYSLNEWQMSDIEKGILDLEDGRKKNFDEVISKYK